jgi:hypothetical protein
MASSMLAFIPRPRCESLIRISAEGESRETEHRFG